MNVIEKYKEDFLKFSFDISSQPNPFQEMRLSAFKRFSELGFPNHRSEEWKGINFDSLKKNHFILSVNGTSHLSRDILSPYSLIHTRSWVMVNGNYIPEISSIDKLPLFVKIKPLSHAIQEDTNLLIPYLGKIAKFDEHPFVAMNTAFWRDGIFISIPANQHLEIPIHILYCAYPSEKFVAFYPRTLIIVGENSRCTFIEHYVGLNSHPYLTSAVSEIVVEKNATVNHIKIEEESLSAHHVASIQVSQKSYSTVFLDSLSVGGELVRNDLVVNLVGEGSYCQMSGLVLAKGHQLIDNHTILDHTLPHCTSDELYKGIYTDKAHGIFNGRIIVRKGAQKTDAHQANKNLLLSKYAKVNSNPQLEIYADDIKCNHGSSTGQLEEDAIFYLRSRGLDVTTAQRLLVKGFADQIFKKNPQASVKNYLQSILSRWLSGIQL